MPDGARLLPRMRSYLNTCRLMLCLLASGFATTGWASSSQDILGPNPTKAYVAHLKTLYKTKDAKLALSRHINSLLQFYAYGEETHHYQLKIKGTELVTHRRSGDSREISSLFSVYGLNPYVKSECGKQATYSPACWIKGPHNGDPWLIIKPNQEGIEEIRKAATALLIEMQK
ncbi:hypothetical protein M5M_00527 [Simiduia agarivorans SA1 = DSM 21679]|uniref:Uncharacterized protein n=2 Tax=Simiduia TaxID=447467 RepID=R9S5W1_SIMAS|nr:hypothetical protein M5M_00527 [Simiduia agarivorans SA1 = DSM 21679]